MTLPLLRNLLTIGDACCWVQRCDGEAEGLLDGLVPEIEASRFEAALLYVRALKAIERHHEDKLTLARWLLVAEALAQLIRAEVDAKAGGLYRI